MCYLYFFCLHCCLINIHIFDYPDSRLSGLFTEVPTSPDNRGSTVLEKLVVAGRLKGGLGTSERCVIDDSYVGYKDMSRLLV